MAPWHHGTCSAAGNSDNDVSASEAMFEPLALYFGARRDPAWPHEEAPSPTAAFLVQEPRWGMDPGSPESLMIHQASDFSSLTFIPPTAAYVLPWRLFTAVLTRFALL